MGGDSTLCDQFPAVDRNVDDGEFQLPSDADDLFSILETWDADCGGVLSPAPSTGNKRRRMQQQEEEAAPAKRPPPKTAHITVERNRRKQMNEHLAVLRTLMPAFYVKRGDQASIIGGVVDYIQELQQVKKSLEAKKQRKQVLVSPSSSCCISPRIAVPISSPRTPPPTPGSPYKLLIRTLPPPPPLSPAMTPTSSYLPPLDVIAAELVRPEVRVEFAGANLVLKTVSQRAPGQVVKIIAVLEGRSLEILHANITTVDDHTDVNAFTVKIGIECELSAEELVQEIQQTLS